MRQARRLLYAAALACGAMAFAAMSIGAAANVAVTSLYRAEVIVTGTEEPERSRGFRAGLSDVLVKLTGDACLADSEQIRPLLDAAGSYVASFEYEDRMKGIPLHDEQGTRERPHYLRIRFADDAVDAALAEQGLKLWGAERPLLAVWLGVETPAAHYVLHDMGPEGSGQRLVIVEHAKRRGIPVALPTTGGAVGRIGVETVAAADMRALRAALPSADAALAGVLDATPDGHWNIRWRLDWQGARHTWQLLRVSFDTALKDGLERAALVMRFESSSTKQ